MAKTIAVGVGLLLSAVLVAGAVVPATAASGSSNKYQNFTKASAPRAAGIQFKTAKTKRTTISVKQLSDSKVAITYKYGSKTGKLYLAGNYSFSQQLITKKIKRGKRLVVTVPKVLRAGSGRAIYVKVKAKRISKTSWLMLSLPKPASSTASNQLTVASYNTCLGCTTKYSWLQRRGRIAATIKKANPDLIGVQENTTSPIAKNKTVKVFEDTRNLLASSGYQLAYPDLAVLRPSVYADSVDGVYPSDQYSATDGQSRNAQLLYKSSKLKLLSGGVLNPDQLSGATKLMRGNTSYRKWFAWGKFRQISTGKEFLAISIHLPVGRAAEQQNVRSQVMEVVFGWIDRVAAGERVILLGDFNSPIQREPNGVVPQVLAKGYTDTAANGSHYNLRYPTTNYDSSSKTNSTNGFPTKAFKSVYAGSRIDYIFAKGISGIGSYTTQVDLKNGKFDTTYQGSDHKLVKAKVLL